MLRRGIKEAVRVFHDRINAVTPPTQVCHVINEALLLALSSLNVSKQVDTELLLRGLKLAEAREKSPSYAMELRAMIQICEGLLQ
jgi:hypothetical protein